MYQRSGSPAYNWAVWIGATRRVFCRRIRVAGVILRTFTMKVGREDIGFEVGICLLLISTINGLENRKWRRVIAAVWNKLGYDVVCLEWGVNPIA